MRPMKDFSSIIALITECIKNGASEWTKATQIAFKVIKQKLCQALTLALPNLKTNLS